ncbi:MAG: hypothetical protein GY822_07805 [Deltaproteobacteria bacterium]|nr:hypothetical protein [Deltaproteobacteria bacterium]
MRLWQILLIVVVGSSGCQPEPCCLQDEDCPSSTRCIEGACSLACVNDDGCDADEICVRETNGPSDKGLCVRPTGPKRDDDGQCILPTAPDGPDAGEGVDAGQHDGGPLDPDAGQHCQPDSFEPNDGIFTSSQISSLSFVATLCAQDVDFYQLPDAALERITIRVLPASSGTELALIFYDDDGAIVSTTTTLGGLYSGPPPSNARHMSLASNAEVQYAASVVNSEPTDGGILDAGVVDSGQTDAGPTDGGHVDAGGCANDVLEPNDSPNAATEFFGEQMHGILCPDDDDWFSIYLERGQILHALASVSTALGPSIEVVGPLPSLAPRAFALSGELSFAVLTSGTYAVRVFSDTDRLHHYDLDLAIEDANLDAGLLDAGFFDAGPHDGGSPFCLDDGREPNDTPLNATPMLGANIFVACPGNDDYFFVSLDVGQTLHVSEAMGSDVRMALIGPFPQLFLLDDNVGIVSATATMPGVHYVRVRTSSGVREPYAFSFEISEDDAGVVDAGVECTDDFEPNDEVPVFFPFGPTPQSAEICSVDDVDRFLVEVNSAAGLLTANLAFSHAVGDLDMRLYRLANQQILATAQGVSDQELLQLELPMGQYMIEVYGFQSATGPFQLSLEIEPVAVCVNDTFETNDQVQSATLLPSPLFDAVLCAGDRDFYRLDVPQGTSVSIRLDYAAPPALELRVLQAGSGQLATSSTGSGLEEVTLVNPANSPLFIRVSGPGTATGQPYTLEVTTGETCFADSFEPNDSPFGGPPMTLPSSVEGTLCAEDEVDFFTLSPAVSSLRLSLEADDPQTIVALLSLPDLQFVGSFTATQESQTFNVTPGMEYSVVVTGSASTSFVLSAAPF